MINNKLTAFANFFLRSSETKILGEEEITSYMYENQNLVGNRDTLEEIVGEVYMIDLYSIKSCNSSTGVSDGYIISTTEGNKRCMTIENSDVLVLLHDINDTYYPDKAKTFSGYVSIYYISKDERTMSVFSFHNSDTDVEEMKIKFSTGRFDKEIKILKNYHEISQLVGSHY